MNDPFEPGESLGISKDVLPKKRPIYSARCCANARKRRCNLFYGATAWRQQPVYRTIGIEQRNPKPV
jgi:hypothetical protein